LSAGPSERRELLWPLLVGAALRLYLLPSQILVDDEWHLVHKLRDAAPLGSIVGEFGANDHSIGLGLCMWLLMRVTALDELLLRLPALVAGLALIAVVPAVLARSVGRATALVLAWLLAIAPLLVFFSRLARPYAVTTLLVSVAFLAMRRWLENGSRLAGAAYVASAVAAPVFHLPALPAVLAPLALPLVTRPRPRASAVLKLAATTLAVLTAILALPAWRSGGAVAARIGADRFRFDALPQLAALLAGSGSAIVVSAIAALALGGLVALRGRDPILARQLLVVIALHAAAVLLSGASALDTAIVAARYVVVVLPLALVFPAAGLVALGERIGIRRPMLVGAAAAGALVAAGPLGWIYRAPNDFTNHISYQADYVAGRYFARFRPGAVSAFYDGLAARPPGSVTIVEAPWHYYFHPLAWTQRRHRQHVLLGFIDDGPAPVRDGEVAVGDHGFRLRNALHLADRAALRARRVDYVVLHRDPRAELRWPTGVGEIAVDMAGWEARYREWFGAPLADDGRIVVFAVQ
jgi:hypothetical protein